MGTRAPLFELEWAQNEVLKQSFKVITGSHISYAENFKLFSKKNVRRKFFQFEQKKLGLNSRRMQILPQF